MRPGDPARGLRQFTIGSGGIGHYSFGTPRANSAARDATSFGVLKLRLRPGGYDWEFLAAPPGTFTDSGSGTCH